MADLKLRNIQLGDSATPSENVIVEVPSPNDGTFNIKRGDGTNVMNVGVDNKPDFAQGFKSQGQGISPFASKNVVVNGACEVVQDVASRAFANNTGGYGGPDMFRAENFQAGGQFTQSQGTLIFNGVEKKTVKQTVDTPIVSTANGDYWYGIFQQQEGLNVFHLQGQKVGLSFIFNSNVSGVYSVSFRFSQNTGAYYLTSFEYTAGSPKKIEISVPETPIGFVNNDNSPGASITVGFLNSGTFNSSTTEQWVTGANNGTAVPNFTNWGATAGNFIELTELQLEQGSPSSFERIGFVAELQRCQRYYFELDRDFGVDELRGAVYFHNIATNPEGGIHYRRIMVEFPVDMRASPSVFFIATPLRAGFSSVPSIDGIASTTHVGLQADVNNADGYSRLDRFIADARL